MFSSLSIRKLLYIDALAATSACICAIGLKSFLSPLFNLPENLLLYLGLTALVYACFSFYLAKTNSVNKQLLNTLVVANTFYGLVCMIILAYFVNTASLLGILYLLFDSCIVLSLAFIEFIIFNKTK